MGHFGPKNDTSPKLQIGSKYVFYILHIERRKQVHENFISSFSRINSFGGNLIFSVRFLLFCWAWSKLSQAMVTIGSLISHDIISFKVTPGSLNGQGTIWQGLSYLLKKDFSVFQTKIKDKVILTAFDSRLPKMTLKVHSQV